MPNKNLFQNKLGSGLEKRLRTFDRNLLASSGFLERRVLETEPQCWFCSTTTNPPSKEHVFPRWLLKALGLESQIIEPFRMLADMVTIGSKRPPHPLSSLTVGNVCQSCNNGWMSRLEASAPSILISNQRGRMTIEQAEIFSRWMTKTAVSINVSMPFRLLFDHASRHALSTGMPASTYVFVYRARKASHEINWKQITTCLWLVEKEFTEIVNGAAALTYVGHINLGKIAALVVRIPEALNGFQAEVISEASLVWPPTDLPTWGGIPRFNHFTEPSVTIRLTSLFQRPSNT